MTPKQPRGRRARTSRSRWLLVSLTVVAVAALTGVIYAVRPKAAAGPVEAAVTEIEHVHGLAVDPFDPTVLWIGTHVSLIRVRNGLEWLRVGRPHYDMMGFNVHPKEPNVLLTSGHPGPGDRRPNPLGVEISRDGGQTWQPLALVGQADFHAMTIGRADPKMLYGWNVSGRTGLYRSREGGRTWEYLGDRGLERVFYLAVHPERSTTVFAGTGHGFMISEDAGTTWRIFLSAQLFSAPVTAVEAHPKDPRIMYAYAMRLDLGLVRSEDGGRQWTPVGFYPGERDAVSNFALDPTNSQVLYFATFSGDVYRSRDGAKTWDRWVTRGRVTATAGP